MLEDIDLFFFMLITISFTLASTAFTFCVSNTSPQDPENKEILLNDMDSQEPDKSTLEYFQTVVDNGYVFFVAALDQAT